MGRQFIFGYGSLVNVATHDYGQAHHATLQGWRRVWQHTKLRDLAYLSAVPDEDSSIQGVVLDVPDADPALENREAAYGRADVSGLVSHKLGPDISVDVFAIEPGIHAPHSAASTLLLSYIDVVVQGYLREMGEAGVARFFESTDGWGGRIIDDRAAPLYPRHQVLTREEIALTDHWLTRLAAQVE